ncbi:hypothetical protein [Spongiactinospora sp. TRM90649]|uniref:hypothetical protein n=1 Tax=Spongiactinospora sp. TRM90649 TaxID=3031114 RepID=UPI0023F9ADD1|nr:hypothetical protein [Spongiactinospora sp. TRM90649]MDF5757694.1 hypothetical protein [Spongiactinospora sp. TRM90649]
MTVFRAAVGVAIAFGVLTYANGGIGAKDGDGASVSPRSVHKGGVARVTIPCDDYSNAYVTSDAFGRVDFNGERSVDVTVSGRPGHHRVRGRCAEDADWVNGDAWLDVGDGDRFRGLFGLGGDGRYGDGGHGGFGDENGEDGGYYDDEDDYDSWPDYGPATGGGSTAMAPVSPAASVGAGFGVVAVAGGLVALARRRRAAARR